MVGGGLPGQWLLGSAGRWPGRGSSWARRSEQLAQRDELRLQLPPVVVDGEAVVEGLMDGDRGLGVAEAVRARKDLEGEAFKADGVVVSDDAFVLKADDAVELARAEPRAVGAPRSGGGDVEGVVEAAEEAGKVSIGLFERDGAGKTQFGDEAVLEGAPEAFDTPFGLWSEPG